MRKSKFTESRIIKAIKANAHAESLNAQIKLFRANLRGVTDTKYFLYRLQKIFA